MTYGNVLHALADPTRRHIFEALNKGPCSVGDLAARQPVSRPAVSQHLKVLMAANLVSVQTQGTRRLYYLRREGLEGLRQWLDGFWDDALASFGAEVARQVSADDG